MEGKGEAAKRRRGHKSERTVNGGAEGREAAFLDFKSGVRGRTVLREGIKLEIFHFVQDDRGSRIRRGAE
jgi:hypothetical protein